MRNLRQTTHVALAMLLATLLAVGLAGGVQGQVGSAGDIDIPAVTVVQRAYPNTEVHSGGIVNYEVEVRTSRSNGVGNVMVHMNLNPSVAQVIGAEFIELELDTQKESVSGDAWVYERNDALGKLSFQTGRISKDKAIVARIMVYVKMDAPAGALVSDRLTYEWISESGNTKIGLGNTSTLAAGASDVHQPHYMLYIDADTAPIGAKRVFTTDGIFAAGEPVALWYNTPQGFTFEVGVVPADLSGKIGFTLDTWSLGNGSYSMVAHGNWTGFEAVSVFNVGDAPAPMPAVTEEPQQPPEGTDQQPGCLTCHAKHNVQAPHPPKPVCTDCHGESKPPLEKGCVECHTSPSHQNVVQMPHPPQPTQADEPCVQCHGGNTP